MELVGLYQLSDLYGRFLNMTGFERSLDRYLEHHCPIDKPASNILDVGCGTGVLGLHFLERFPAANLVSFDREPRFLSVVKENAERRGLSASRLRLAVGDVSQPHQVAELDGAACAMTPGSFDLITVGAVLGYAADPKASLRRLVELLAPGGCLLNMEMNEKWVGRWVSRRYAYPHPTASWLTQELTELGCEVSVTALGWQHLPASLTRVAIRAIKPV